MLHGKLRIAPTCYHVLHLIPVMAAHEMNFFYDEGLKDADGSPAYEILRDSMAPFGLEKLGISQAMKEKSIDIALDVQPRTVFFQRARRRSLYRLRLEKPAHQRLGRGAPYQVAQRLEGKKSGDQRLQQHPPLGHTNPVEKGRIGLGKRYRVGAGNVPSGSCPGA
jgi:hypothetical protein